MGAFILFCGSRALDTARSRAVFRHKGFQNPTEFSFGAARLLLYSKQMLPVRNWFESESGHKLFSTGTPVYKGLGYADGMNELLRDWESGKVNREELIGFYCLLFFDGSRVSLVTDPSGLYHVFSNADGTVVSSSLQAVLVADGRKHELNRAGVFEQLVTGSVAGPDTIFSDIVLLTAEKQAQLRSPLVEFQTVRADRAIGRPNRGCFSDSVSLQIQGLKRYFRQLGPFARQTGATMGLSGGYDSRLLFLLAREAGMPVYAHTYDSSAHIRELNAAVEITRVSGTPLRRLPLRMWGELEPETLAKNMEDALHFWDGRTNMTMGSFNDVDTRWLRSASLGGARLALNGIGGELYRNREHFRERGLDFNQWLAFFVIGPECMASLSDDGDARSLVRGVVRKYQGLMGLEDGHDFDLLAARRWYRDVWLPFSAGPRLCAENQLAFALMPFADAAVTSESLRITPHLGTGGRFESAMIRALDARIAAVGSSYGHGFDRIPLGIRLRDSLASVFPLGVRHNYHVGRTVARARNDTHAAVSLPTSVQEGLELLKRGNLPIRWDVLLARTANRDRFCYVAHFLHSFKEHLSFDRSDTGEC